MVAQGIHSAHIFWRMTTEHPNYIDAIGTSKESDEVVLTVIDASEWGSDHLLILQEKLNSYLRFIESGELYSVYPSALGKPISVHLYWRVSPTHQAEQFLFRVSSIMEEAGFRFSHGPLNALC